MKHYSLISIMTLALIASSCSILGPNKSKAMRVNPAESQSTTPAALSITDEKIAGEWIITTVNGKALPQEDQMPYVTIEPGEHRFYASNGCNIINGDYRLTPNGQIEFSSVLSTMRMCEDIPGEAEISAILSDGKKPGVSVRRIGNESYLTLTDGQTSITGVRHNMGFLDGEWRIVQVNGKAVNDEEATLFIDVKELKVHGNTGCNFFNGTLYFDPSKSNSVEFSGMGLTRMACPKADQEHAIMLALEETVTAIQGDNGRVMLLNSSGDPLMVIQRPDMIEE